MEGERDVLVHGLEGLKDKGIAGRGGFNAMGQGDIDDVDKEGQGEESDSVVIVVGMGQEVRAAGEGIRARKEFSRDVDHCQVEVSEVNEPVSLSVIEVLGGAEVSEILVVGEDLDRERRSVEVVSPRFQGTDDSEEFSVIDVVVSFCRGE